MDLKQLSKIAVAVIVVCFFFPWVSVSCGGSEIISLSGFDLAAGKGNTEYGQIIPGHPAFFLILLSGLAAGGVLYLGKNNKNIGGGLIIAGILGLGMLLLNWLGMGSEELQYVEIKTKFGLWGTIIGFITIIITGSKILNQIEEEVRPPQPTPYPTKTSLGDEEKSLSPQNLDDTKKCPYCAEIIKKGAIYCRYCGRDIEVEKSKELQEVDEESAPGVVTQVPALSVEEQKYLFYLQRGLRNFEIASQLQITALEAVEIQNSVIKKFEVSKAIDAVEIALNQGLIPTGMLKVRVCGVCGKHSPEDAWYCGMCGNTLSIDSIIEVDPWGSEVQAPIVKAENSTVPEPVKQATKLCPFCAEEIKAEAIVCKFCKKDLPPADHIV